MRLSAARFDVLKLIYLLFYKIEIKNKIFLMYRIFSIIRHTILKGAVSVTGAISVFSTCIRCTGLSGAGMLKYTVHTVR